MLGMIAEMAKELLSAGWEELRERKQFKRLQAAVHDRIRREIRFNLAMVDEAIKIKSDSEGQKRVALICSMSSKGFDEISSGGIPLTLLFGPDGLDARVWPEANNKPFTAAEIKKYKTRIRSINTRHGLVERLYHRITVIKAIAGHGVVKGDIKYLRFLLRASEKALTDKSPK